MEVANGVHIVLIGLIQDAVILTMTDIVQLVSNVYFQMTPIPPECIHTAKRSRFVMQSQNTLQ